MAGRRPRSAHATPGAEITPSWWVGLPPEVFYVVAKTRTFSKDRRATYQGATIAENDPGYRVPFARTTWSTHRRDAKFVTAGFDGVTLARESPRAEHYHPDPAPVAYAPAVMQMEAERAYRTWWAASLAINDRFLAYDAAATLHVLCRLGHPPAWTADQQQAFERWCAEHQGDVADVLEMIE